MAWVFLVCAVLAEVTATVSLRMAMKGPRGWYLAVGLGYLVAFTLLSLTLSQGIGIGVAYGIWAAGGVALTAILSKIIFDEPLSPLMIGGIALVMGGVLFIEVGSTH